MTQHYIQPLNAGLRGEIEVPGDKSISHRALIFASLAQGESEIKNLLLGHDVLNTMKILQQCGVPMTSSPQQLKPGMSLTVIGQGIRAFEEPTDVCDCGNSGTTMRLMMGLMSGQKFRTTFTGDASLNKRPMDRIIKPLEQMGAQFEITQKDGLRLVTAQGAHKLKPIVYQSPVASAQIKSAILLASLFTEGITTITEPSLSRDHTERMLKSMGAKLEIKKNSVSLTNPNQLEPFSITIPGDFSSAAFFIVAALIVPESEVILKNVGLNPTRAALIDVLKEMGGKISIENFKEVSGEPVGDIRVQSSLLKATHIRGEIIAKLIDEIPIFAIAAARAQGVSEVSDAQELRVKESDRIAVMCHHLIKLGVEVEQKTDGFKIKGTTHFKANTFESNGDHRIAMSFCVAALLADGKSIIQDADCIQTSYPTFLNHLGLLSS